MTTSRRWCRLCRRRHKNHKERNILEHLPEIERPLVQRCLRAAWAEPDPVRAKALLEALARSLAHKRPGAAASLREGLSETLRGAATGLLAAEAQFRRVQGHRELPALAAALQRELGITAPATVTA